MNYELLQEDLKRDEGWRRSRYLDTVGKWTIGVGHNISDDPYYPFTPADEPLTDAQIYQLLNKDIAKVVVLLDQNVNWWRAMEEARQRVLANMCFNMGWGTLSQFQNTLDAMHKAKYAEAAAGMRASKWASQVGARAERLAIIMERGI